MLVGLSNNSVCDFLIDSSLSLAKTLDKERAAGKLRSPLHGLPVSIKSSILIKDCETSIGFSTLFKDKHEKDSLFIECLKDLGCIPFVRSNVPTGQVSNDGQNEITGTVKNPLNENRAPGGCSSGEAGLVYTRCSPLGFGTDSGGSTRLPSLFHGICGFKFSHGRITQSSTQPLEPENKSTNCLWKQDMGVFSRDARDFELVTKC